MGVFEKRKPTFFEISLLVIGGAVLIVGFYMINRMYMIDGRLSWNLLIASLLWLMLIFNIIITSSTQDIKEELSIVIKQTNEEIRLLRKDINKKRK